jgi:transcriptional regulator with XRE-family HTH domain
MGKVRDVHRKPGWVEGDTADFLGLSDEESLLIDLKITTAMAIRRLRAQRKITQEQLAAMARVDQSRVAKIENCSPRVTLDAMVMLLFVLGGTLADLTGPLMDERTATTSISKIARSPTRKSSAVKAAKGRKSPKASTTKRIF